MGDGRMTVDPRSAQRLRSAAAMTDYQMERVARDGAAKGGHACLADFPDLREVLPWIKSAA